MDNSEVLETIVTGLEDSVGSEIKNMKIVSSDHENHKIVAIAYFMNGTKFMLDIDLKDGAGHIGVNVKATPIEDLEERDMREAYERIISAYIMLCACKGWNIPPDLIMSQDEQSEVASIIARRFREGELAHKAAEDLMGVAKVAVKDLIRLDKILH